MEINAITCFGAFWVLEHSKALSKASKGITKRDNIEDIHDLRVATRRIRACLSIFCNAFNEKDIKQWQKAIKDITKSYGSTRDLDVQIDFLKTFYKEIQERKCKSGIRRVLLRLQQKRKKVQDKVTEKAEDIKQNELLNDMVSTLEKVKSNCPEKAIYTQPLYQLAFDTIHGFLDQFLFYEVFLHHPEKIRELHLMRIAAKRLRYTMEVFEPIYNGAITPYLEIVKSIQQTLGSIRDCDVWLGFLPDFLLREKERTLEYYGNVRAFNRLTPGIDLLIENRKKTRTALYTGFIKEWRKWRSDEVWLKLREIILEASLKQYPPEKDGLPEPAEEKVGSEQNAQEDPSKNQPSKE